MASSGIHEFLLTHGSTQAFLIAAIESKNTKLVKLCMEKMTQISDSLNEFDLLERLQTATRTGCVDVFAAVYVGTKHAGTSALSLILLDAVVIESLPMVEHLLSLGADPNYDYGELMSVALEFRNLEIFQLLLEKGGNPTGFEYIADKVCKLESIDAVKLYIAHGKNFSDFADHEIMNCALKQNKPNIAQYLIDEGFAPSYEILQKAVKYGDMSLVKSLLDRSEDMFMPFEETPLMSVLCRAFDTGRVDILELFKEEPEMQTALEEQWNHLAEITSGKHESIIKWMMKNSSPTQAQTRQLLQYSAEFASVGTLSMIADGKYGLDNNGVGLKTAVKRGDIRIVKWFFDDNKNEYDTTKLTNALLAGSSCRIKPGLLTLLLSKGANPYSKHGREIFRLLSEDDNMTSLEVLMDSCDSSCKVPREVLNPLIANGRYEMVKRILDLIDDIPYSVLTGLIKVKDDPTLLEALLIRFDQKEPDAILKLAKVAAKNDRLKILRLLVEQHGAQCGPNSPAHKEALRSRASDEMIEYMQSLPPAEAEPEPQQARTPPPIQKNRLLKNFLKNYE